MLVRSVAVWFLLAVLAVVNGALRDRFITPKAGAQAAHVIGTVCLCLMILAITWLFIAWVRPVDVADAWLLGVSWLSLTVAFEFLAGHYVFGNPWSRLLADYNLARGRIWVLVLVTTTVAPVLMFQWRLR